MAHLEVNTGELGEGVVVNVMWQRVVRGSGPHRSPSTRHPSLLLLVCNYNK